MIHNSAASYLILVITAAVLFYAAFTDLKHYKIRNDVILVLVVLFVAHTAVSGTWTGVAWNLGFAALVLVILIVFYSRHLLGGGDVKLLTVALLWVGVDCALPFAVLLLIFASIHSLAAKFGWAGTQSLADDARKRIPFAPSVAAALIGTFVIGCLSG